MRGSINSKRIKNVIKKIAINHGRSEADIREMVMWQFKLLIDNIRDTNEGSRKYYHMSMPGLGIFKLKPRLKFKFKKEDEDKIGKNTSTGRSK